MNFVPLHVYSSYSYLKSALRIDNYINKAKELGYEFLSLTDLNNLTGVPKFVHACKFAHIKPIIGEDVYISNSLITLIALNENGYKNLLRISYASKINKDLKIEDIKKDLNDIVFILSTNTVLFREMFFNDDRIKVFANLSKGIKHFYIGLDDSNRNEFINYREFFNKYSYDLIAFPMIKYLNKEDAISLKILEAIEHKDTLQEKSAIGIEYIKNKEELSDIYFEDEINKTNEIAKMVNFNFITKRGKIMHYQNDDNLTSDEYLHKICLENLNNKGLNKEEYISRLNYELSVIKDMGYSDYFLLVQDYVKYAKNNNILVGPGRGSAIGSLVSFALDITQCDPIKYNLIFERFLNKERQSLPDIDVDFEDIRRDEVALYLKNKYGNNRVSKVLAVQKFGAKQALNDIGRVFNYEKRDIELFTKCIKKDEEKLSLREIYKINKNFNKLVNEDKYYLQIVSLASKIEGLPRQKGLHAAGIIINNDDLIDIMPVDVDEEGNLISDFEKDYLEEQYFLKMDLLSLRNLTTVKECLERIKINHNIEICFDNIPIDDKEAISLIASGKTMGLFQIESLGMRKAIKELRPTEFLDIAAVLALYRPGPMDNIIHYAKRKHGIEKYSYLSDGLKDILSPTYGIIVYQEQIMQIANKMANFSYGEADLLRRAISKKDSAKLAFYLNKFLESAVKNGYPELEANKVYKTIYKFGDYGFNKSHAIGYAFLTSKMAYLKAHYKKEFYASILSSSNSSNFLATISEMSQSGISLLNPDINISSFDYENIDNNIIMPLSAVKGIMMMNIKDIIMERKIKPFEDLFDFVVRINKYKINSKQIISLIDAGAFDKLCPSRASLRASMPKALNYASMVGGDDGQNIIDIGMFPKPKMTMVNDNKMENLNKEFDALGIMVSDSPLKMAKRISKLTLTNINDIYLSTNNINVACILKNVKVIKTKKGELMAFASIYDESGEMEITIFSEAFKEAQQYLKKDNLIIVNGKYNESKNDFYINKILPLGDEKHE